MKNSYLFPSYFKKIGWILLPLFLLFSISVLYMQKDWGLNVDTFALLETGIGDDALWFKISRQDLGDEIAFLGMTLSLLFIAFSKQKEEDEYISQIRLESLIWAVIANYVILTAATWLVYGFAYFQVTIYNMFTVLVLFIIKFHLALYKLKKSVSNEE